MTNPKFKTVAFWATLGNIEVNRALFGSRIEQSANFVDLDDCAAKLTAACEELDSAGFDVINILPLVCSTTVEQISEKGLHRGSGTPVAVPITRGAAVVGCRRAR